MDGVTQATPLDGAKTALAQQFTVSEAWPTNTLSAATVSAWQWVNLSYLAGGLVLLKLRVINWHIPLSLLTGLGGFALFFFLLDPISTYHPGFILPLAVPCWEPFLLPPIRFQRAQLTRAD